MITTISSHVAHGIVLNSGNYGSLLSITNAGKITGSDYAIYAPQGLFGVNITNAGTLSAVTLAVYMPHGGILNNSGSIYGAIADVELKLAAEMINTGHISGGSDYGIGLSGQSSLNNSGSINATGVGLYTNSSTVTNTGGIHGSRAGILLKGGLVSNAGSISGGTVAAGIGAGSLINTSAGHISGTEEGVYINGADASMSNAGTITGALAAVYEAQASVKNSGLLQGGTAGLALESGYMANTGRITGTNFGAYVYGGMLNNTGNIAGSTIGVEVNGGTLINGGTISGSTYAVYGTSAINLTLTSGAKFVGKIVDRSGNGELAVAGASGGRIAGLGTSILGFNTISFNPNFNAAPWTIEGNVAALAAGQDINNFFGGGTIVLTDFAATTAVYKENIGIVLSNGAATETLQALAHGNVGQIDVYPGNGGSTVLYYANAINHGTFNLVAGHTSIISASTSLSLTPGEGSDADDVTIQSGVTIDTSTAPPIFVPERVTNVNVVNFGALTSSPGYGIDLSGTLTNYGSIGVPVGMGGTLDNAGVISASANVGIFGTLINSGTVTGAVYGVFVENSGLLSGGLRFAFGFSATPSIFSSSSVILGAVDGVYFQKVYGPDGVTNFGHISGGIAGFYLSNHYFRAGGAGLVNYGSIGGQTYGVMLGSGGSITNAGTISGGKYAIEASNREYFEEDFPLYLTADPGAVFNGAVQDVTNRGQLSLAGSTAGALDMGTSFSGFSGIDFAQGATWALEGAKSGLAAGQTINGFSLGDTIILDNFVANALDTNYVTGNGLHLTDTSGNQITLDITGNFSTGDFIVTDPSENTMIEAVCYLRGTRIATPAGEIPVESLNIGDAVITRFNGYRKIKWIGRQNFARKFVANNFDQIPVRITAGALGASLPRRDLFISPGHSMLIDNVLVLASSLVNGITITQDWAPEEIQYYQIEFETHDCVLAEGAWSESYADTPGFRARFHNAAEFYALYPNHLEPKQQTLCAPRPLAGPALAAVLSPLVQRAVAPPGRLHGYIDDIDGATIRGWAWDESNPHLPVQLEILLQNQIIGRILACDYRRDLATAGYGRGRCGFEFSSPLGLPPYAAPHLRIRRAQDGAELFYSDHFLARLAA